MTSLTIQKRYFRIVAVLFCGTGIAKLISIFGDAALLTHRDEVFPVSNRVLLGVVGGIELLAAGAVVNISRRRAHAVILWMCSNFFGYRFLSGSIGPKEHCKCLGTLTDSLHINPKVANGLLFGAAVVIFASSWYWLVRDLFVENRQSIDGES